LLTLGKSYEQVVKGDKKSFPFNYVDWEHPENNVFHVTDEFEIKGKQKVRRVDIVLFVNGIPFVAIENKRRDKKNALDEAISQHLRNQNKEEVPGFFHFTQMLIATSVNELSYAATDTSKKFWSVWREEEDIEETVADTGMPNPIPIQRNGLNGSKGIITKLPTVKREKAGTDPAGFEPLQPLSARAPAGIHPKFHGI
jgi:type I site-specific restriction-modification system R (restriction) subunit